MITLSTMITTAMTNNITEYGCNDDEDDSDNGDDDFDGE